MIYKEDILMSNKAQSPYRVMEYTDGMLRVSLGFASLGQNEPLVR